MMQKREDVRNIAIIAHVDHSGGRALEAERCISFQSGGR